VTQVWSKRCFFPTNICPKWHLSKMTFVQNDICLTAMFVLPQQKSKLYIKQKMCLTNSRGQHKSTYPYLYLFNLAYNLSSDCSLGLLSLSRIWWKKRLRKGEEGFGSGVQQAKPPVRRWQPVCFGQLRLVNRKNRQTDG
jgi:hypothetical protein